MKTSFIKIAILFVIISFVGCRSRLEEALEFAGENRHQMERVLEHYKDDEQKRQAAEFLISNMHGHRSCDTVQLGEYYRQVKRILSQSADIGTWEREIMQLSGATSQTMVIHEDICYLDHQYLIRSIDRSFELWRTTKWARHLSFDEFCEYLLPYKVSEYQYLDDWKHDLTDRFETDTVQYRVMMEYNHSNQQRATHINQRLKEVIPPIINFNHIIPLLSVKMLERTPFGRCEDYAHICNMMMRSKGIPVAFDFTPQWASRSFGHSWNVLFNNDGRNFDFAGISGVNPGEIHLKDDRPSKIYRATYSRNDEIVELHKSERYRPDFVQNIFIKDVTAEYIKTSDLSIENLFRNDPQSKYCYLAVFDNTTWVPVAYGKKRFGKTTFKDVARDIVYLPVQCSADGIEPINYPFRVNYDGSVHFFKPDTVNRFSREFTRKYPIRERMYPMGRKWIGGEIQAANRPDFFDAITVHRIEEFTTEFSISTDTVAPHRYWRYLSSPEGNVFVSEMIFLDHQDTTKRISGEIIGTDYSWLWNPKATKAAMFDGDLLTYYFSVTNTGDWAGVDFSEPTKVGKIILYPASDGNSVEFGDSYVLYYYDQRGWVSLGTKLARDAKIHYDNIPSNGLYLLDDITKGREKRIFTVEKGVVWW